MPGYHVCLLRHPAADFVSAVCSVETFLCRGIDPYSVETRHSVKCFDQLSETFTKLRFINYFLLRKQFLPTLDRPGSLVTSTMPQGKSPNFLGVMSSDASKVSVVGLLTSMGKPLGLMSDAEPARAKQRSATAVPKAKTGCRSGSPAAAEAPRRYYRENEYGDSRLHG
jgi:hypothetical protein